jgi:hypothetical protein
MPSRLAITSRHDFFSYTIACVRIIHEKRRHPSWGPILGAVPTLYFQLALGFVNDCFVR